MHKKLPLSNIRVVEVADAWVGPVAGLFLADLGAEVIKVESPTRMDTCRGAGTPAWGTSAYPDGIPGERPWNRNSQFITANWGKYDVAINLRHPKGLQVFKRLIKISDVFLSNFVTGVAEKLGISYEALAEVNPQIIYLSACTFGATGPYARRVGMGNTADAAGGLLGLRDYGDGDSTCVSYSTHTDEIGASTNAFAILTALYYRRKTGRGMHIDESTAEASMSHIGEAIMDYTMNHRIQRSLGNRDMSMCPQGCYPCQGEDEWVTISISSDEEWQRFTKVMGSPAWARDERFADVLGRLKNQDELDKLIGDWTIHHTKYDVMGLLQREDIAAGAVLNNADVYSDPHIKERGFLETMDQPDAGRHVYPGRVWRLKEAGAPKRKPAPRFGEHNDYVLSQIIGLTSEEILELEREGIIGSTPLLESSHIE